MANERLPMQKIRDVLRLDFDGLSRRKIALLLQVGRTTGRPHANGAEGCVTWSA
ncbi:MAG: hypothetical protein GY927_20850 [bacterium]|nr:hypothetical protein [bacterium]